MDYKINTDYIGKKCVIILRKNELAKRDYAESTDNGTIKLLDGKFGTLYSATDGEFGKKYSIVVDGESNPTSFFYRSDFIVVGDVVMTNSSQKGIVQSLNEAFGLVELKTSTGSDMSIEPKDINRFLEHRPMQKSGLVTPAVEFIMSRGHVVEEAPEERKSIGENWFVYKAGEPKLSGDYLTDIDVMELAKKSGFSCKVLELGGNLNSVGEDMFDQMTGVDPTYEQMDYVKNNTLEPIEYRGIEPPTFAKGGNIRNIRLIPKGEEHRFTGGATSKPFAGNFEIKGWKDTAVLYSLDDFDKMWVRDVKLKANEEIYRYTTQNTLIGGMMPLVKLNKKSGLVYFLTEEGNEKDEPIFATRGIPARFANFRQYAKGGDISLEDEFAEAQEAINYHIYKVNYAPESEKIKFDDELFRSLERKQIELEPKILSKEDYSWNNTAAKTASLALARNDNGYTEWLVEQSLADSRGEEFENGGRIKPNKFENGGTIPTETRAELDAWLKVAFKNPGKWYFYNKIVDGVLVQMKFFVGVKEVDVQIFRIGNMGAYMPRNYSTKKDTQAMIKEALDRALANKIMANGGDIDGVISSLAKQLGETTDRKEADHIRSEISYWKDKKAGRKLVVEEFADGGNISVADSLQEELTDLRIEVASALFLNGVTRNIDDLIDIQEYQHGAPFSALNLIEHAVRLKLISPEALNENVVDAAKETVDEYSRQGIEDMGSSDWAFAIKEFLTTAGFNAGFKDSKLVIFSKMANGGNLNFNVYMFSSNKQATASLRSLIGYCLTIAKKNVDRKALADGVEFGGSAKYFQFELALRKALAEVKKKYPTIPDSVSIGYDGSRIYANYSIYSIYKSFDVSSLIDQKEEELVEEYAAGGDIEKANKLAHVFSAMDYAIVRGITTSDKTEEEFDKALNKKFKSRKFPLYATHKAFQVLTFQKFAAGGDVEKYFRGGEISDYKTFKSALIYLAANSNSRTEFEKKVKSDLGTYLTKFFPLMRRDIFGISDDQWIAWGKENDTEKMASVNWKAVYDKLEEEPSQDISELEATLEVLQELYDDAVKEKNQRAINDLEPQMEVINEMLHEADKRKKARTAPPVLKPALSKEPSKGKLRFILQKGGNGYKDYDVDGHDIITRVKVPFGIKKGDIFNVYYGDGAKTGFEWEGDLEESIRKHEAELEKQIAAEKEKPVVVATKPARAQPRGRGYSSHGIERSHDPSVRPSPSVSATIYPKGYEMVGNDGNMWQIIVDSRQVHRWKRV